MTNQFTLTEFTQAFAEIKARGWLPSQRRGPTGVGYTLEKLLGIRENNIATPDLGRIELKAHRSNTSSPITLFTFNRKAWKMKPLEAIHKYGTPDENGRYGIYFTLSYTSRSSTGLLLHIDDTSISLQHISGELLAVWQLETLASRFMQKIPALILVNAQSEMRGDKEWFRYCRARLMTQTSAEIL